MKLVKYFFIVVICCFFLGIGALFGLYKYLEPELPDVSTLKDVRLQTPMQVFSADGELIAQFGEKRRIPLTLDQMPTRLLQAFLATEDSRFYEHHGLDPIGIARAVVVAASAGSAQQGASTITQQLARNFFLSPEKTIVRKAKEAFLAIRIERSLTKDEILELYLNKIYLGSRAYGVGAAAHVYFGKDVNELTLSEMAVIAGLPKAPSSYNPIHYPDRALTRRNTVLYRMLEEKYITQEQYNAARSAPLVANYHEPEMDFSAPYLAEMVRQEMVERYGENAAYNDGFKVYTTITRKLQLAAMDAVRKNIMQYDTRHGYRGPAKVLWKSNETAWNQQQIVDALKKVTPYATLTPAVVTQTQAQQATVMFANGETAVLPFSAVRWAKRFINDRAVGASPKKMTDAIETGQQIWLRKSDNDWVLSQIPAVNSALVSLDPYDGAVKALVGGYDFNQSKFNRAMQSVRQAGSNIKPFIYAAALDRGMTLSTLLTDLPISMTVGTKIWSPKNSPPRYDGPLRLRVGLGMSKNVMIVRAMRAMGVDYAADYLQRFGFPAQNISRTESLALGAASFTPMQVARGYAVFANGGYLIDPYFISRIEDDEGRVIFKAAPKIACGFECDIPVIYGETEKSDAFLNKSIDLSAQFQQENQVCFANDLTCFDDNADSIDDVDSLNESAVSSLSPVINLERIEGGMMANESPYAPHVISSELAFLMQDALKSDIFGEPGGGWTGTGWRAARDLKRQDIGGKTGTTNGSKDAWFSGFGPSTVTSVWIGFDDHRRGLGRGEAGAQTAQPAWIDYMKVALDGLPIQTIPKPENIISVSIDMSTGQLPSGGRTRSEYFIRGTEPTTRGYSYDYSSGGYEYGGSSGSSSSSSGTTVTDSGGQVQELF